VTTNKGGDTVVVGEEGWRLFRGENLSVPSASGDPGRSLRSAIWDQQGSFYVRDFERVWSKDGAGAEKACLHVSPEKSLSAIAADPHHSETLAAAVATGFQVWDLRAAKASKIAQPGAHQFACRAVEYNPNVPNQMVTTGEDGAVRLWDLRKLAAGTVLQIEKAHSHWVLGAQYNPYHDSLLLTCGSDNYTNLWRLGPNSVNIKQVSSEDAVYQVAWSSGDPWSFAALSYDGSLTITNVPIEEKYRILL